MRRIRPLLVAGTLVLAAGIGTTVALTTRQAPTATAASPAGRSNPPAAPSDPTTSPPPTPPKTPGHPTDPASPPRQWPPPAPSLARELGMTEMVAGPFRSTGARTGEVGFRHKYGEGRRLLPQTGPYAVVVRLQRLPAGWWVLGVTAAASRSPARPGSSGSAPRCTSAAPRPTSTKAPCTSRSPRTVPAATCCWARASSMAGPAPNPATSAPSASASRPAPLLAG